MYMWSHDPIDTSVTRLVLLILITLINVEDMSEELEQRDKHTETKQCETRDFFVTEFVTDGSEIRYLQHHYFPAVLQGDNSKIQ